MEYKDKTGKVYEVSYSQRLQKEQLRLSRQKNILLFGILLMICFFAIGSIYLYFRLDYIDFLTNLSHAMASLT